MESRFRAGSISCGEVERVLGVFLIRRNDLFDGETAAYQIVGDVNEVGGVTATFRFDAACVLTGISIEE